MRPHARPPLFHFARATLVAFAPLAVLAWPAQAQDADTSAQGRGDSDPVFVVSRTVHPRIAYKGLEAQQNPVHTQATTFPARIFHGTLGTTMGELTDAALTDLASAGVATGTDTAGMAGAPAQGAWPGHGGVRAGMAGGNAGQAAGQAPVGAMGSAVGGAGGAVRNATGAIGSLLGEGLKNTSPVQQGGGG
jgi:hypothetical protein